ncbi:hypothetical protein [Vibrio aestuarianus]|uniref:hypothetical protein n=1 Tax=Vibrio aestuarianus TaxID=28171 RepID=UPI00237CBE63|nr:hypothetical protein [Vibrio aestuarianus]MDE1240524.1 hypothetical protein [Vibrio aestuarianus]
MEIKIRWYGGLERFDKTGGFMLVRTALSALSCSAPFLAVSNNVPEWVNITAWLYIGLMMVVAVMALKSEKIMAWCEKKEIELQGKMAERDKKNK